MLESYQGPKLTEIFAPSHAKEQLGLNIIMATNAITCIPVSKENIDEVRKILDRIESLLDTVKEESLVLRSIHV